MSSNNSSTAQNTKKRKLKKKSGRPSKLNQATIDKLEQAFSMGCSDMESCLYADISPQTLYNWQEQYPELLARKILLKQSPTLKARSIIIKDLHREKSDTAKWFLERNNKAEFSLRTEQTGANGGPIVNASVNLEVSTPEEAARAYNELLKGSE